MAGPAPAPRNLTPIFIVIDAFSAARFNDEITRLRTANNAAMQDAVRTTPGLPQYRASPTRQVGWWFGTDESLAWFGVQ